MFPQDPRPSTDPSNPLAEVLVDGIVGSIQSPSTGKTTKQPQASTPTPSTPKVSTKVNSIKSIQTFENNKEKGKSKNKKPGNQQENPKPTINENDKGKIISMSAMQR